VSDEARNAVIVAQGTNSAIRQIVAPLEQKLYVVYNNTSGGYAITIGASSGAVISVPNGVTAQVYCDGTNFYSSQTGSAGNFTVNGNLNATGNLAVTGTSAFTGNATMAGNLILNGSTSGAVTVSVPAVAGTNAITFPAVTGTAVIDTATQTLTNKTLTSPTLTSPAMTGAVVSSMASSVITAGTAVASTSGTSIDFTSIPSWVKRITVMFNNVSLSSTANFLIQIGNTTPTTSGYSSTSTYLTTAGVGAGLTSASGFIFQGAVATYSMYGSVTINNVSGNIWVASGVLGNLTTSAYTTTTTGVVTLASTLNLVRITSTTGTDTFTAGTINILYE